MTEREYRERLREYGPGSFVAKMGAEAIQDLLKQVDLEAEIAVLKEELKTATGQKTCEGSSPFGCLRCLLQIWQQARMDGSQHPSRYSTRSSSDGPIGWWPFCCL